MGYQKDRFEVFKRDSFTCQYCGRTPPEVILELDHVIPKADNGPDDINNYITSCFDCNRGKGATSLSEIPESLAVNIERMREKQSQIQAYNQFLIDSQKQLDITMDSIGDVFTEYFPRFQLNENFRLNTLKNFLNRLPPTKVKEAMAMACSKFQTHSLIEEDRYSTLTIKYFCGICWNWIKHPETRGW